MNMYMHHLTTTAATVLSSHSGFWQWWQPEL